MTEWFHQGLPDNLKSGVRVNGDTAKINVRTIDDRVVPLQARRDLWGQGEDDRWMTESDFNLACRTYDSRDFSKAKLYCVSGTAKGQALIDGFTMEEAEIISGWAFDAFKGDQARSGRGLTLDSVRQMSLDFAIKNNAGQFMTGIAPLVMLVPMYGTIIGGALMIGGQVVTHTQGAEIAKRAANSRKMELVAARTAYMKGEINEDQYMARQAEILQDVGEELMMSGGLGSLTIMDDSFLQMNPPSMFDRARGFVLDMFDHPAKTAVALAIGAAGAGLVYKLGKWAETS